MNNERFPISDNAFYIVIVAVICSAIVAIVALISNHNSANNERLAKLLAGSQNPIATSCAFDPPASSDSARFAQCVAASLSLPQK